MKISELFEGISDIVYHYTTFRKFDDMVNSGIIKLSPVQGYEQELSGGYKYFLSTTRSRLGSFHVNSKQGVLITLDGRKLSQRMKGKGIDYWGGTQGDEMEDRVFSNSPDISLSDYIVKVDMLATRQLLDNDEFMDNLKSLSNERYTILVFDNQQYWRSGRESHAIYIIGNGRMRLNPQAMGRRS